ncbi:MAG: class I SAM-dependent methyltransferase, partial [Candidatus Aminicenantes bacterium]
MNSKKYFEKVAGQWDQMRQSFFSDNVREKALAAANVKAGQLAADIGAGTGFITEALVQKGLKVIAVDQSEAMLEEMKKKFGRFDTIDYRIGDSNNLPIPDEIVDAIFSNMYLHHVESPQIAIKEMVRVLKAGGKIVLTDMDVHQYEFLREEHNDRWMGFKREDIKKWFIEAGLQNVQTDCVGEDCCSESDCGT